jgi:hypothetical protein
MRSQTKSHLLFVLGILLFLSLACVSTTHMGELKIDKPVTFEAHDEVDYAWEATLEPGEEYILSINNEEYSGVGYQGFIHIFDEGIVSNSDASNLIAEGAHFTPSVSFVAPEDGKVMITVYMINWVDTEIEVTLTKSDS